ncbi:MAG: aspartate aminotransferase family protein [Chloroflexi bacterium]|nr:aspartate aminotransferase family protein [Chloroflexota bacterium]
MSLLPPTENAFLTEGSRSGELYEEATRYLPGGNTRTTVFAPPHPLYAARGQGCWIFDVDGQARLDFVNNYTSLILGHANAAVVDAVTEQLTQGTAFGFPTEWEIKLAREIANRVASVEQVRFTNSGTEGVMMAIKAARAFTGRAKIAKFEGCYHGAYDPVEASQNIDADSPADLANLPTLEYCAGTPRSVLDDVIILPYNRPDEMERRLRREGDQVAAVIVDLLPNRAGLMPARREFVERLRAVTREIGALLIVDEVLVFRVAYGGSQALFGAEPDLSAFGKIIGGGFPVGAVGGRADVMAVFDPRRQGGSVPHGGTFNANPITVVAGLATLAQLPPSEFERLAALGDDLRFGLRQRFVQLGVRWQITGAGSLFRIHPHARPLIDYRSSLATPDELQAMSAFYERMLANGIVISPQGLGCLSTPMGAIEIQAFVDAAEKSLHEVKAAGLL